MDKDKLVERIAHHEEMIEYELTNYERGNAVGSFESAERALGRAANHATVLAALRSHAQPK